MNDLNFFEVSKAQDSSVSSKKIGIIGGIILGLFIISTLAYNTISSLLAAREISKLNNLINDSSVKSKYEESLVLEEQQKTLSDYYGKVSSIFDSIVSRDKVSPQFMASISGTIPKEVSFSSLNFSDGVIDITGTSTSRDAIAEFQHNINELKFIEDSHISTITSNLDESEEFNFSISCNLKEEYYNENK